MLDLRRRQLLGGVAARSTQFLELLGAIADRT
jgi:hypothetical protein